MSELQKAPVNSLLPQRRSTETAPLSQEREFQPATATTYREAEIAASMASDVLFFLRHRDRFHRVRKATAAEIRIVQVIEHRLIEPTEGTVAVVLVQRVDDRCRRRVIIESFGLGDLDAMGEAEVALLFEDVVSRGWTWV